MIAIIDDGNGSPPREISVAPGRHVVGRDPAHFLHIDNPAMSESHFELVIQPDGVVHVRDLGSTNGIWIDGRQVGEAILGRAEKVQVGTASLVFPPQPPPVRASFHQPEEPAGPSSFLAEVPGAFRYALHLDFLIVIAIILFLTGLLKIVVYGGIAAPILVGIVTMGYRLMVAQEIIVSTARGEDEVSGGFFTDLDFATLREACWKYFILAAVCFGPGIFVLVWADVENPLWKTVGVSLLILGLSYFPMNMLLLAVTDSLESIHPLFIIRSIFRVFGPYLLLVVLFAGVIALGVLANKLVDKKSIKDFGILTGIGMTALSNYLLFVVMRLLGLFYRHYEGRLGWGG